MWLFPYRTKEFTEWFLMYMKMKCIICYRPHSHLISGTPFEILTAEVQGLVESMQWNTEAVLKAWGSPKLNDVFPLICLPSVATFSICKVYCLS